MKKFKWKCPECNTDYEVGVGNDFWQIHTEPVYEEKNEEIIMPMAKWETEANWRITKLANQFLSEKCDELEKINKDLREQKKEAYDNGWKLGAMAERKKSKSSSGKGSVSKTRTTKSSVERVGKSKRAK